jgi:hypothetical protein
VSRSARRALAARHQTGASSLAEAARAADPPCLMRHCATAWDLSLCGGGDAGYTEEESQALEMGFFFLYFDFFYFF